MARSEKAVVTVLCMVHDGTRLLLQNRVKADWRGYTLPAAMWIRANPLCRR